MNLIEYNGEDVTVTVTVRYESKPIGRNFYFGVHKIEVIEDNILRLHNKWPGFPDIKDYKSENWERFVVYGEDGIICDENYIKHRVNKDD